MGRGNNIYFNDDCDDANETDDDGSSASNTTQNFQAGEICEHCKIPMLLFWNRLIEHFDILFSQNKMV